MTPILRSFFCGFILIFAFAVYSLYVSNYQFGGYDLSPLIDLNWRLTQGQIPGVDFINTMPVILLVFTKLLSFGELRWSDLVIANILITVLVFLFLISLSNSRKVDVSFFFVATLIICLPLIYSNHIWHSSISQLAAICFVYSSFVFIQSPQPNLKTQFLLGLGSGLLFISKQNIAPLVILISLMAAIINFQNKWIYIRSSVVGILLILTLSLTFLQMPFQEFIHSQAAVLGRAKPDFSMFIAFSHVKSNYPLIVFTLIMIYFALNSLKNIFAKQKNIFLLIIFSSLASLLPILTDWDTKLNNLPLPLFIFSLAIMNFGSVRDRVGMYAALSLIVLVAVIGGYSRERMKHVGDFYDKNNVDKISNGYFSGLFVGNRLYQVIAEIEAIRKSQPNSNIFFGPRVEFGYALTNTISPKGLPLWWHPGTSYSLNDSENVIGEFMARNFDILVFLRDDRTRIPEEILIHINSTYKKVEKYNFIDVYYLAK